MSRSIFGISLRRINRRARKGNVSFQRALGRIRGEEMKAPYGIPLGLWKQNREQALGIQDALIARGILQSPQVRKAVGIGNH